MNSVFILGAGASAHAGVPLMNAFFEVAEDLLWTRAIEAADDKAAFELVLRARAQLQAVLSKARFDVRNLEAVFTAFEMAQLFGELGSLKKDEIEALTSSMRKVIVSTIEYRMRFPVVDETAAFKIVATREYTKFAKMIATLIKKDENVSFITFNYDIGLEVALAVEGFYIDYCLNPEPDLISEGQTILEVMKLHGSINWAECSDCATILPEQARDVIANRQERFAEEGAPRTVTLRPLRRREPLSHCGKSCKPDPMIVPPTDDKSRLRRQIGNVWKRAAARLREADNIFVIGYSWPETDQFFHQLYAVGTVGNRILRRFWICDPIDAVRNRFKRRLLGQSALAVIGPARPMKFDDAITAIAGEVFDIGI